MEPAAPKFHSEKQAPRARSRRARRFRLYTGDLESAPVHARVRADDVQDVAVDRRSPLAPDLDPRATERAGERVGSRLHGTEQLGAENSNQDLGLGELLLDAGDAARRSDRRAQASRPRRHPVELSLSVLANSTWAVFGLVLWLPLLARTLILSVFGLAHAALTRQRAHAPPQRIRRASRFYSEAFLRRRHFESGSSGARWSLRLPRLFCELAWTALFWIGILWATGVISLSPQSISSAGVAVLGGVGEWLVTAGRGAWARAPAEIRSFGELGGTSWLLLGLLLALAHLTGWWLAARRD